MAANQTVAPSLDGRMDALHQCQLTVKQFVKTVMLPAGGYAVINFKSDNPGQWFLHCHIEVHQLEGMALIINEAQDKQKLLQLPDNLNKCGDSNLSMEQYLKLTSK